MKMQDHWRDYKDKVYPKGMTADQMKQLHQAFFAGAFMASTEFQIIAALPDEQADEAVAKLIHEILEINEASVAVIRARN